jgi:hypothetical protein
MTIIGLALLLISVFILWKLFVDGWLFKIIFFFAGCLGLYVGLRVYVAGTMSVAVTISHTGYSWAAVITAICAVMLLLTTRID